MISPPTTVWTLLAQIEQSLAALQAYLVHHNASPDALSVVRALQWTVAGPLRVALGLRSGIQD